MPCDANEATDHLHIPDEDLETQNPDHEAQIQMLQQLESSDSDTWSENDVPLLADGEDEDEDDDIATNPHVSDDNNDSSEVFSTPPPNMDTSVSDTEPMDTASGTTTIENAGQIRSRNVARRGRNRHHPSNNDYMRTPFERGVTFNGFARNLEPEAITGYMIEHHHTILYFIRWRNDGNRTRLIESTLLRTYSPLMLIDFFEEMIVNNSE